MQHGLRSSYTNNLTRNSVWSTTLKPELFDEVLKAALMISQQDCDDDEDLAAPSNLIKLRYDMQRLCGIKLGQALKNNNEKEITEADRFLKLISLQWDTKIARVVLENRKFNAAKPLPTAGDIQKMAAFLNEQLAKAEEPENYSEYRRLVLLILAKVITYNRRRCGEMQAIR